MSLSLRVEGGNSCHMTGLNRDKGLVGHCKILAWQLAKLPRYWREGAVEVRPFTAKMGLLVSEAQGLSGEAMKGNPTTTVIPRVDESKPSHRTTEDLTEPSISQRYPDEWFGGRFVLCPLLSKLYGISPRFRKSSPRRNGICVYLNSRAVLHYKC